MYLLSWPSYASEDLSFALTLSTQEAEFSERCQLIDSVALATDAWILLSDALEAVVPASEMGVDDTIFTALAALSDLGRARPTSID